MRTLDTAVYIIIKMVTGPDIEGWLCCESDTSYGLKGITVLKSDTVCIRS